MKQVFKKILIALLPLIFLFVLVLINNYILSLLNSKFIRFALLGILLGCGLSVLIILSQASFKTYGLLNMFRVSAVFIVIILMYQYFTYTGDVIIPALSFLNIIDPTVILMESMVLGFTSLISVNINQLRKNKKKWLYKSAYFKA